MIDWTPIAQRLGHASEEMLWHELYDVQKLSITTLATRLGISRNTIRQALARRHIQVRGRGGPNNLVLALTPEVIEEVRRDGVLAVAKRMELNYTTLYKRLRRAGIRVADLKVGIENPETKEEDENHG